METMAAEDNGSKDKVVVANNSQLNTTAPSSQHSPDRWENIFHGNKDEAVGCFSSGD